MRSGKRDKLFDNLVTREEIAKELGLTARTVGNWMSSGKIPCIRIGRKNYALRSSLEIWLEDFRLKQRKPK